MFSKVLSHTIVVVPEVEECGSFSYFRHDVAPRPSMTARAKAAYFTELLFMSWSMII